MITSYTSGKILCQFKRQVLSLFIFLLLFNLPAWSQPESDDQILRDAIDNGIVLGIPGISVAVGKADSVVWAGTGGYSNLVEKNSVTGEDKFGIGSITKTFVAITILQLVQEGKIDLDNVPTDYLNLEIVSSVPNTDKAQLKHLLNHQSGIPTWEFQPDWIRKGRGAEMDINCTWSKIETLKYVTKDKVQADFEPGQSYSYSNTNYTILGLIIETVTGNDIMTEIRNRFLRPLKMNNTYLESFEEIPGGYVNHYHHSTPTFKKVAGVHQSFSKIDNYSYLVESSTANLSPEWVAGGMVSSAGDLVHWANALRTSKLLKPEMQKKFLTYYPPVENKEGPFNYMQGIYRLDDFISGKAVIGHAGGTLGFSAMMFWIEDTDIVIVALVNVGSMHSGLMQWPINIFYKEILVPSVIKYFGDQEN